jgi:uncharacterized protein (TIGR03086 family)
METLTAFVTAVESTTSIVKGVRGDQMELTTPCRAWTVRDLMNHMLASLWRADGILQDRLPKVDAPRGGLPSTDLVGDDPSAAYSEASAAALAAARIPGALTSVHATPLGDIPGGMFAALITTDQFVHGWDLARATRQAVAFDDDLAIYLLELTRPLLSEEIRSAAFAPEVATTGDASAMDRLVGFLGRRP